MSDPQNFQQPSASEVEALRDQVAQLRSERDKYKQLALAERERKDTLGDLFQNTSDLIFSINADGRFLYVNRAWQDTLQYGDVTGLTVSDTIHPDSFSQSTDLFQELLRGQADNRLYEITFVARDGTPVIAEGYCVCRRHPGRPASIRGIFRDITERVHADAALRESEEKFRLISEQSLMIIMIIQDGIIKYINDAFTQLTGYTLEEMGDMSLLEFAKIIHPDDRAFVMEQASKKQAGDREVVTHYSYRGQTKYGDTRVVDQYSKTITYQGKPADLVTLIDITDRNRAEE